MSDRGRVLTAGSRVKLALASDEWLVACVRRGDTAAFEALYDRHARELLRFCIYMLGSRQDAEDAVQSTFASAYRALRADSRPVALRPWLFTIARNDSLSMLRRRRPVVELRAEVPSASDPVEEIELREEVRRVFEGLRELPESQRAALVLAEVHGLSHHEVGEVLGVRPEQVKAFVYQARSKLVSERAARDADCREIREELAGARGAALLRGRLRRHMRSCPDCRSYADGVARQRRQLGALLPVVPSLALRYRALEEALSIGASDPVTVAGGATVGASVAGTAAEVAGGGFKALACKVAAGVVCLGASAGVGVSVLSTPGTAGSGGSTHGGASAKTAPLVASVRAPGSSPWSDVAPDGEQGTGGSGDRSGNGVTIVPGDAGDGATPIEVNNGGTAGEGGIDGKGVTVGDRETLGNGEGGERPGGSDRSSSEAEHRAAAEQHQTKREGRRQLSEERRRAREEPKPEGHSRAPKTEEELALKHEKALHKREERKPEGHSRAPKTEEELALKHEKAVRKSEERRKLREEEAIVGEEEAPVAPTS